MRTNTKRAGNPFTLNCSTVPCTFLFIFHAGSPGPYSNNLSYDYGLYDHTTFHSIGKSQ